MAIKAPFRFARINRWIYEPDWAELVSHDVPFADGLSGESEIEITARSSILVGGNRRKADAGQEGEVRPFQLPDNTYAIPGSALQGMARSILEIAGFGRLGPWVADRKFGIRDLSSTQTARQHYQRRLSKNENGNVTMHSKAGWLMKSSTGSPCILPCEYARIHLDDILQFKQVLHNGADVQEVQEEHFLSRRNDAKSRYMWFLQDVPGGKTKAALNATFMIDRPRRHQHSWGRITITYSRCRHAPTGEGTVGTLVLTGKPQDGLGSGGKKLEFVFHGPDRPTAKKTGTCGAIAVEDDAWEAFKLLHEEQPGRDVNPNWGFWKAEFEEGRPVPVFYWKENGLVTTLGTAFAFKAAHEKSARDLLAHSHPDHLESIETMKLDLAHLIFGVAAEHNSGRGLKRRAHFGLARADNLDGKPPRSCNRVNPSILLGPKPSYAGLYVRQKGQTGELPTNEPLATYTTVKGPRTALHLGRPELAGVKIWPARNAGEFRPTRVDPNLRNKTQIQTKLITLPPGTVFRSRLTFHNLRPVELGALLWSLSFGDNKAFGDCPNEVTKHHRLGMGKPLGLGEVTIRILKLQTEAICPCSSRADNAITAADLVSHFEEHMKEVYGDEWFNSKQVSALLKARCPHATPRMICNT